MNNEINVGFINNRALVPNILPTIHNFFGVDFDKIPLQIQKMQGYPAPCLCNFWKDPSYYLKKLNYFPFDWCKNHCPNKDNCAHKTMISNALNSLKYMNTKVIWLMVKAYLDTNILDKFFKTNKHMGIIDENILGLCYELVTLNDKSIRDFNDLADTITRRYSSLREIYKSLKEIFMLIDNIITYNRDVSIKINAQKITKKVEEFLASYTIKDIKEWNDKFKAVALKHPRRIQQIYNIMDLILKMLQNNEDDIEKFETNLTISRDTPILTLFVSKVERIREIVHKFHKLVFTDALLPTVITEITNLLQIGDNYKILYDENLKARWKEVKIYKLNSRRAGYPKNTLLNLAHDDVSPPFFTLIGLSKQIIQREAERNRNIGLIGSMKIFQYNRFGTTIQKELAPVIEEYDMDVSYQHYGAAPGENTYDNIDWVIAFGSYNIPQRDRNVLSNIVNINMNKLEYLFGPGSLIQFVHRGRPLQRPNDVSAYFLTNDVKGYFEQEESFRDMPTVAYKNLIEFIQISEEVTTIEIAEKMNRPKRSILNILNYLKHEKILKSRTEPSGRGRPNRIWSVT